MLTSSRCTSIEITGKRVIDLGGLIHRGKPALLINTQEALLLPSFFHSTVSRVLAPKTDIAKQ